MGKAGSIDPETAAQLRRRAERSPADAAERVTELAEFVTLGASEERVNAAIALAHVAQTVPDAVVPVIPDLRDALDAEEEFAQIGLLSALSSVAEAHPDEIAPLMDPLVRVLEGRGYESVVAATAISRVAASDPERARPAIPAFLDCLQEDPDMSLALDIVPLAAAFPDDVLPELRSGLESGERFERQLSSWAIAYTARAHPSRAVGALESQLQDEDRTGSTAAGVGFAFAASADPTAVEPMLDDLVDALADHTARPFVRRALLEVASAHPEEVTTAVVSQLSHERAHVRRSALRLLGEIYAWVEPVDRTVGDVVKRLTDPDPRISRAAAEAVARYGTGGSPPPKMAMKKLRRCVVGEETPVRNASIASLTRFGDDAPGELLTHHLDRIDGSTDPVRRDAMSTIAAVAAGSPETVTPALPDLLSYVDDPDPHVRGFLVEVLGAVDADEAEEALETLAEDGDPVVGASARIALDADGPTFGHPEDTRTEGSRDAGGEDTPTDRSVRGANRTPGSTPTGTKERNESEVGSRSQTGLGGGRQGGTEPAGSRSEGETTDQRDWAETLRSQAENGLSRAQLDEAAELLEHDGAEVRLLAIETIAVVAEEDPDAVAEYLPVLRDLRLDSVVDVSEAALAAVQRIEDE